MADGDDDNDLLLGLLTGAIVAPVAPPVDRETVLLSYTVFEDSSINYQTNSMSLLFLFLSISLHSLLLGVSLSCIPQHGQKYTLILHVNFTSSTVFLTREIIVSTKRYSLRANHFIYVSANQ
jgi:hypothetical protein